MVGYSADSPEGYLAQLDEDWRKEKLLALRELTFRLCPDDWVECTHFKMLGYGPQGDPIMHLNAQKGYVALYVGDVERIDPGRELLGGVNCGKGCVRFKKKDEIGENVEAFLEKYMEFKRAGVSLG